MQADATWLANNSPISQHCLMSITCSVRLHTLLHVVAQILKPVKRFTPNISFVPWWLKRSETMLDPFAQLFQHCCGHVRVLHIVCFKFTKSCGLYHFHDALQVLTLLGVVASVCKPLPTRTQQLPTLMAQQCDNRAIYTRKNKTRLT